jgi:hypothetical protein
MSQIYDDCLQLFCIYCGDIGLDCNCTIYGINEEAIIDNTIIQLSDKHAIVPEEMTTCLRLKMIESMQVHYSLPLRSYSSHNSHFGEYQV